eukprot:3951627-Pleurochrysis_carterae.AAC.1
MVRNLSTFDSCPTGAIEGECLLTRFGSLVAAPSVPGCEEGRRLGRVGSVVVVSSSALNRVIQVAVGPTAHRATNEALCRWSDGESQSRRQNWEPFGRGASLGPSLNSDLGDMQHGTPMTSRRHRDCRPQVDRETGASMSGRPGRRATVAGRGYK